ncbi:glycosyltransferase family 2 protein [Bacillus xiapuensis]|uniref:glycosyltransferase family 2 protein n=1 Tax=Bacillus xiapuensis TaxID=2014075 RepID=UPI000C237157|nr:glycosyltransferase [Bacillus xiapuensis]
MTNQNSLVSIIFPVKNEGGHIKNTLRSLLAAKTTYAMEVIVVDDGSVDQCCNFLINSQDETIKLIKTEGIGAAMARNAGADQAKGDFFIFCDAHLFFEDYWIDNLLEPIREGIADATNPGIADAANPSNIGYGYSWNDRLEPKWHSGKRELFPSAHLAGGCLAISRKAFEGIHGFEKGFKVWGREDEEISLKLWLFGYRCYVQPAVTILHIFRADAPPFVVTWDDVNYNLMRMAYSHFNEERIEKCKRLIKHSSPERIMERLMKSDIIGQRKQYLQERQFDDDWYMKKFQINF